MCTLSREQRRRPTTTQSAPLPAQPKVKAVLRVDWGLSRRRRYALALHDAPLYYDLPWWFFQPLSSDTRCFDSKLLSESEQWIWRSITSIVGHLFLVSCISFLVYFQALCAAGKIKNTHWFNSTLQLVLHNRCISYAIHDRTTEARKRGSLGLEIGTQTRGSLYHGEYM